MWRSFWIKTLLKFLTAFKEHLVTACVLGRKKRLTSSGCPQPVLAISEFSSDNRGTHTGGPQGNLTSGLLSPPLSRKVIYSEKHHLSSVWSALLTLAEFLSSPQRYPHPLPTTIVERKESYFWGYGQCTILVFLFYSSKKCAFIFAPPVGCLSSIVLNNVCAEFDTIRLVSHSLKAVWIFCVLVLRVRPLRFI